MNTDQVRLDFDKRKSHQCRWLYVKLMEALGEIDRLRAQLITEEEPDVDADFGELGYQTEEYYDRRVPK